MPGGIISYSTVRSRLTQIQAQLADLARSMMLAQRTGQVAALELFRTQFRTLAAEAATIREQINRSEAPSDVLVTLDAVSDRFIQVGRQIGEIPAGLGATFRLLPVIVAGAAVLAVVGLFLWLGRRRAR